MIETLSRVCARLARLYTLSAPVTAFKRAIIAGDGAFGWLQRSRRPLAVRSLAGPRFLVRFPDMIQRAIFFCGVWEPSITALMQRSLGPGDIFVDVGANIGYNTCLAALQVGDRGQVWAIEPSPSIADLLEANVRLNRLTNVTVCRAAVSDRDATVDVVLGPPGSLGTTRTSREMDDGAPAEAQVRARRLTDIVPHDALFAARLIKIDVEGAEGEVIAGIADQLHRFDQRTEWIVEVTPAKLPGRGSSLDALMAAFEVAGYRAYSIDNPYSIDWYVRQARVTLRKSRRELLAAVPRDIAQRRQVELVFTRRAAID